MHAAIVETDPETAEITILRYCVVHDCGTLINPMIVEGQVHGGVAQGVGGALYERMAYDEYGQLLNASFMDFLMPYASEVPAHRDRPPRDAVAAEPAGHQGRRRGRRASRSRPSSPRPSRTPRASRSPRCRSRPASCGTCARHAEGHPDLRRTRAAAPSRRLVEGTPDEDLRHPLSSTPPSSRSGRRSTTRPCSPAASPAARRCRGGPDAYTMTVTAGVAAIKGTYEGEVALTQQNRRARSRMKAAGRRRARHGRRRRRGHAGRLARRRHRPDATTPTPSSAG